MNLSILVVDDEPMTRDLLRLMLGRVGFEVIEAGDGLEALERVEEHRPDVMILDVMMPKLDGYGVCERLRAQKETADLPIIMLSAKTHLTAVEEGLRAGATRYLSKPISRTDLLQNLSEVLPEFSIPQPQRS